MSNASLNSRKAFILYLSGIGMSDIRSLAEVEKLMKRGVAVELESTPITSPQAQYYQLLSGRLPASFGFFDTLMPADHLLRTQQGASSYTIVEDQAGRASSPKMLDELLRTAGWHVDYMEVHPSDVAACTQALATQENSVPTCKIVKCIVDQDVPKYAQRALPASVLQAIEETLRLAQTWIGENGLLVLLSDSQSVQVHRHVNLNNFFADVGVIARDEQSGQINWPDSLAYYAGHGQIWLNVLGRDFQGAVHPLDDYEEVRDTLITMLPAKLRDEETGDMVIQHVYRKEELYTGDYVFCAPDLIVVFKPGYAPSPSSMQLGFDEATFTTPPVGTVSRAGVHPSSIKGFLLASSTVLASGVSLVESAPLTSVAPSLMHALGLENVEMDGVVIEKLFLPSYLEAHPVRTKAWSGELSQEDEELVINRLRDLGYV